jgi:hypothetical protein
MKKRSGRMTFEATCPSCGKSATAKDDWVGKQVKCSQCKKNFHLTASDSSDGDVTGPLDAERGNGGLADDNSELEHPDPRRSTELNDIPHSFEVPPAENDINTMTTAGSSWGSRLKGQLPLILSSIAVVISLAAMFKPNNLPGKSISAYDFSTPEKALLSQIRIELNNDVRASLELTDILYNDKYEERLKTNKVHSVSEYAGKKILFISYNENGLTKYDTQAFEKDADSGFWNRTVVGTYDVSDKTLKKAMEEWEKKSNVPEE